MHILLVADGRSPITHRWIETVSALDHRVTLLSTFPCPPVDQIEELIILPIAFSQFASQQGSSRAGSLSSKGIPKRRLISASKSAFLKARYLLGPLSIRFAVPRFHAIIRKVKPDLVHALRIPFEGMLSSYTPLDLPLAVSIWGNDLTLHAPSTKGIANLTRRTLQRANGLLTDVSRDQRLALQWGYPSDRLSEVVPGNGGIDLKALQIERVSLPPEIESKLPAGLPLVINPRGVRAYARTDTFFQSIPLVLEKNPQVAFVCPAMQGHPQALGWVKRLNLDQRTVLLPNLPQVHLWELFKRSTVSVSITTHDGTPNTLLEAMACGSFPIAGDIESLREWIDPGTNGLLVDPNQPTALAEAMVHALNNPDLRSCAADKNLGIIAERADISVIRPKIDRFYQLLGGMR